jgi:hypothetical protein
MVNAVGDAENRNDKTALQSKVALLQEKIDAALKKTRINMRENRKRASLIKLTVTACSAFATIFLGLKLPNLESQFKDAAFVLTALVTLLNALEPFFNYRALWVEHETALWKFHRLRDKIEYHIAGRSPELVEAEDLNNFHAEYQAIWDDLSQSWINYRKQENS